MKKDSDYEYDIDNSEKICYNCKSEGTCGICNVVDIDDMNERLLPILKSNYRGIPFEVL